MRQAQCDDGMPRDVLMSCMLRGMSLEIVIKKHCRGVHVWYLGIRSKTAPGPGAHLTLSFPAARPVKYVDDGAGVLWCRHDVVA